MTPQSKSLTFDELLPELIGKYELPKKELSALSPLADQTNRLTPAFSVLSENIWESLPVTNFQGVSTHTELAKLAATSTEALHAKQNDVKSFAESICFEAIELRVRGQHVPDAKASALRAAREPLCRTVQQVNRPLEPVLTAELIAQPLHSIIPVVNQWFRNSSHTVAAHLLLSMHMLVQLDVVGLVEWPGETACKLNFFRHVVTQDQIRRKRSQSVRENGFDEDGFRSVRLETWEHIEGRNRYSIERHEHHVMNAGLHTVGSAEHPIPVDKQVFLDKTPPWIRQHLKILEGDLILERVIERKVGEELWQSTPQLRSSYEIEPAIVLGHYVITGWGQREIDRENFRRRRIASTPERVDSRVSVDDRRNRASEGSKYSQLKPWTIALASGAVASMLFSWLQPAAMLPIAIVFALAAIFLAAKTAKAFSTWKHSSPDMLFVAASTIALAATLFAIQSCLHGLIYGNWQLLLFTVVLGGLAYAAKSIAVSRME